MSCCTCTRPVTRSILYDADTKAYLRTITLDADLTTDLFVVPKEPGAVGQGPGIEEP